MASRTRNGPATGWALVFRHEVILSLSQSVWLIPSGALFALLYQLSLGFGLSRHLAIASASWGFCSYADFLTPGLLVLAIFSACFSDWIDESYPKAHLNQFYEGILLTPISATSVVLGEVLHLTCRGAVYALGFLVACQVLGLNPDLAVAALATPVIGILFSAMGVSIPILIRSREQLDLVRFCGLVATMFSGVFYPVSVYPKWIASLLRASPVWQAVNLLRGIGSKNLTTVLGSGSYALGVGGAFIVLGALVLRRSNG